MTYPAEENIISEVGREVRQGAFRSQWHTIGKRRNAALVSWAGCEGMFFCGTGHYAAAYINQQRIVTETAASLELII